LGKNIEQIYDNITKNNIIAQAISEALNEKNDLGIIDAAKLYVEIDGKTGDILDKAEQEVNGLTNLTPEKLKEILRDVVAGTYNEKGENLEKIEFSTVDGIGIAGIITLNLSNIDLRDPNAIAGIFAGITAEENSESHSNMASVIMDMKNYGNENTNKLTTEQWLNNIGSDGISYGNSLFDKTWDKYTNKKISGLDPRIQNPAADFVNDVKDNLGITLRVTDGYRSIEEQNAIFAKNNGASNAKGGESYHNYGLAIDVVAIKNKKEYYNVVPSNKDIVNTGKSYGFEWGGDWRIKKKDGTIFTDPPHFQNTFGKHWSYYLKEEQKKQGVK
jgi:hypothetical protein